MLSENHVVIYHQNGKIVFGLTKGGYCIEHGMLAVSVETERLDSSDFPNCALFSIFDFPVSGKLKVGDSFVCERSDDDNSGHEGQPQVYAYFQFHVSNIQTIWTVIKINGDEIWFAMESTHDNIDYYDERAKPTPTRGVFRLLPCPTSELWNPL